MGRRITTIMRTKEKKRKGQARYTKKTVKRYLKNTKKEINL